MVWEIVLIYVLLSAVFREGDGNPLQYSCLGNPTDGGAWWATVHWVTKSRTRLSDFAFTFHFHSLEKEMATHSSVLAWRIPGTGEPGGLLSVGSHRVGHGWSDFLAAAVAAAVLEKNIMILFSINSFGLHYRYVFISALNSSISQTCLIFYKSKSIHFSQFFLFKRYSYKGSVLLSPFSVLISRAFKRLALKDSICTD